MGFEHRKATLHRYFAGITEQTFQTQLGVANPKLVDYISELLIGFVRSDTVFKIRDLAGRRLEEVALMFVEAEARVGDARRQVHRHIGDFTLFWTGVYPEALEKIGGSGKSRDAYAEVGKRAYYIASTIETDDAEQAPGEVLELLSRRFDLCAYGLREVRREWEQGEDGLPSAFLIN